MNGNAVGLMEKATEATAIARKIQDGAEAESRALTAEERERFDTAMTDADGFQGDADRAVKLEERTRKLEESRGRQTDLETSDKAGDDDGAGEVRTVELRPSVTGEKRSVEIFGPRGSKEYETGFRAYLESGARRALQKDSDTAGGYLSAPVQFNATLIQALDNNTFMREISNVLPPITSAESLGSPSLDNDPADPTWVAEIAIGTEDLTMSFGKRELTPHPLAQFIKVSKTLIRRSTVGADGIVRERLAYKMAVVMENALLNGSGAQQPLGIFTASDDGITTSQDVSDGNTTTSIQTDGLINAEMDMPAQYRRDLNWVFHRDAVKQIRKLKDGAGRYLWERSLTAGQPNTLLSYPVRESEYAPNTFTTGLYVGAIGNFSFYWIVDALTLTIQVLIELYAGANQNGYLSRMESDGMPVLAAAFRRVKLA